MTLLSKVNMQTVAVVSTDNFDRGLCGVRLEADGSTVASNGRMIMAVGPVVGKVTFPDVGERQPIPGGGLVLEAEHLKEALRNLPKDTKGRGQFAALVRPTPGGAGKVGLATVGLDGTERVVRKKVRTDGYPDWKRSLRKSYNAGRTRDPMTGEDRKQVRCCVNRKDLIDLLTAMDKACPDRGAEDPIFIEFGNGIVLRAAARDTGQHVVGTLNAYNTRGEWLEYDAFEKETLGVTDVEGVVEMEKKLGTRRKGT